VLDVPVRRLRPALLAPGPLSAPYRAGRASVNGAQFAAACVLAAGAAIVTGLSAAGQAALARLWFRHRIEVIRGEAVTAVADGVVPVTSYVTAWLAALEATASVRWREIAAGPGLTFPRSAPPPDPACGSLTPGQQAVLDGLTLRVLAASGSYRTWGRPARALWLLLTASCAKDRRP
jgi:hypothetical protein